MENLVWTAIIALVAIAGTLTDFFKRLFKVDKKWFNEILFIVVSFGTAFIAWIIGYLPTFFSPDWACVLFEGLTIAVLGTWTYSFDFVKKIYDFIFSIIDGKYYSKKDEEKKEE